MKLKTNTKLTAALTTALFIACCFCACDKKIDEPIEPQPPKAGGIYAAYTYGPQHRNRKATFWKDGAETDYTTYIIDSNNTTSSKLYIGGVAVAPSGDVYVSGCECLGGLDVYNILNGKCHTALWKNGIKQNLNSTPGDLWYVDEDDNFLSVNDKGDVFVFGMNGNYKNYTVWKNGSILYNMPDVVRMNDFFVSGNDVYVTADSSAGYGKYTLWKNNVVQTIANNGSRPQSIYVSSSGDVYLGLFNGKILKNNIEQTLATPGGEQAKDIADITGSGTDVYVLGRSAANGVGRTVIWKNGAELYHLTYNKPNSSVKAYNLFVAGTDVYAYGIASYGSTDAVVIWKNGAEYKTLHEDATGGIVDARAFYVR